MGAVIGFLFQLVIMAVLLGILAFFAIILIGILSVFAVPVKAAGVAGFAVAIALA